MSLHYVPLPLEKGTIKLPNFETHHVVNVLRSKIGDEILLTNGNGIIYSAIIISVSKRDCVVEIDKCHSKAEVKDYSIHLVFAPVKTSDRLEFIIEKAAEIGVNEITPIITKHSERKAINAAKLNQLLISALKQSMNPFIVKLNPICTFNEFIQIPRTENTIKMIAHCYPKQKSSMNHIYQKGKSCIIMIGPEGDFSENEIEASLIHNFEPISLGENRLRTETAAIVACAIIQNINAL